MKHRLIHFALRTFCMLVALVLCGPFVFISMLGASMPHLIAAAIAMAILSVGMSEILFYAIRHLNVKVEKPVNGHFY